MFPEIGRITSQPLGPAQEVLSDVLNLSHPLSSPKPSSSLSQALREGPDGLFSHVSMPLHSPCLLFVSLPVGCLQILESS